MTTAQQQARVYRDIAAFIAEATRDEPDMPASELIRRTLAEAERLEQK